jgi:Electron transfer DM13
MTERTSPLPRIRKTSVPGRLLAFAAVVAALVVGIFVLGRISDDANVAMGLTAVWFGVVFVLGAGLALRRRELFWPLAVGYGIVAVAAAILVVAPTLFDKEVNERVVTGTPASEAQGGAPGAREREESGRDRGSGGGGPAGNIQVAAGSFESIAHSGTGNAAIVELPSGKRMLTLTDFETDSGPDLRLYVSTGNPASGDLGDFEDLGALKGNIGNQQYELPAGLSLDRYSTVVVWCRAFSVAFTSAALEDS